jgi:hypothetical protein
MYVIKELKAIRKTLSDLYIDIYKIPDMENRSLTSLEIGKAKGILFSITIISEKIKEIEMAGNSDG